MYENKRYEEDVCGALSVAMAVVVVVGEGLQSDLVHILCVQFNGNVPTPPLGYK